MTDFSIVVEEPKGDLGPQNPSGRQMLSRNMDYPLLQRTLVYLAHKLMPELHLGANIRQSTPGIQFFVSSAAPIQGGGKVRAKGETVLPNSAGSSTSERDQLVEIYGRIMLYTVQFNSIAEDPFEAEQLVNKLDEFIIMIGGILIENGVMDIIYQGRYFDAFSLQLHQSKSIATSRYAFKLHVPIIVPVARLADVQVEAETLTLDRIYEFNEQFMISRTE